MAAALGRGAEGDGWGASHLSLSAILYLLNSVTRANFTHSISIFNGLIKHLHVSGTGLHTVWGLPHQFSAQSTDEEADTSRATDSAEARCHPMGKLRCMCGPCA